MGRDLPAVHAAGDRRVPDVPRAPADGGVERIVRPSAALAYAVRMAAGPAEPDPDRYAAKLLSVVLGDSSGSRLYWELVDSGAAEQASLHHQDFLDAGLFVTQLSCDAADVEPLLERILRIYAEARGEGIDNREFTQARNKLAARVVLGGERPRRRLFDVGLEWSHSRTYRSVADTATGAVGMISSPDLAEHIVASGQADLIIMARALLNDPYWPLHAAKVLKAKIAWPPQYERGDVF